MHNSTQGPVVRCIVNTCKHYKNGDYCSASHINIEPRNASTNQMTDCATFERK